MAKSRKSSAKPNSRRASTKAKSGKASPRVRKALRLVFSYEGQKVKLISKKPVKMTVSPSDQLEDYEEHQGFWAELKNDKKKTLYRQVLHNPTRSDAEIFSDDPEQGISRQPVPDRAGVFVVVVPDTAKGHEVTLSRSVAPPTTDAGTPRLGMAARMRSPAVGPAVQFKSVKLKK